MGGNHKKLREDDLENSVRTLHLEFYTLWPFWNWATCVIQGMQKFCPFHVILANLGNFEIYSCCPLWVILTNFQQFRKFLSVLPFDHALWANFKFQALWLNWITLVCSPRLQSQLHDLLYKAVGRILHLYNFFHLFRCCCLIFHKN